MGRHPHVGFHRTRRYRLLNRHGVNTTERYPEFAFLAGLPPGTILDGEMVVFHNGKPDFGLVQGRDKTRSALKIRSLSLAQPATLPGLRPALRKGSIAAAEASAPTPPVPRRGA